MTKYREILRLASRGLSKQSIADSSGVSRKRSTVCLSELRNLTFSGRWSPTRPMPYLRISCFHPHKSQSHQQNGCLTSTISRRNCSATESIRSSSGRNTWRNAASLVTSLLCIHSSAITSSRMSRNAVRRCTSPENPVNRSRLTGPGIRL